MEIVLELLSKIDLPNLLCMGAMLWIMYLRLDKKFDKIDKRFDKVDLRFEKIDEKLIHIDRRLCRLEGAFSSKECCMIKDDRQMKKVE